MRLFDQSLVDLLNEQCTGDEIHFVGLGSACFELAFGNIERISNSEKIEFQFDDRKYTWVEGPIRAPVWTLIGQTPAVFKLLSSTILRMELKSGDIVDFYTAEGPYESMIVQFPDQGDTVVMEIF